MAVKFSQDRLHTLYLVVLWHQYYCLGTTPKSGEFGCSTASLTLFVPLEDPKTPSTEEMAASDVEKSAQQQSPFVNSSVISLSWEDLSVDMIDRSSKQPKTILQSCSGQMQAGNVLALMGPSGCGKTTMLNALAHRCSPATSKGIIKVNGRPTSISEISHLARYVEQEDALIGSLTVRETVYFSARLALPSSISANDRLDRINESLTAFGLKSVSDVLIGTPLQKGISGGQKRRVSVASQLVTSPRILFLDEPTSGLDSAASREVMSYIHRLSRKLNLLVVVSIHQPSTTTFNLLDQILLLAGGRTCFFGPRENIESHFANIGHPIPLHINPAEFLLDLINVDFANDNEAARAQLDQICSEWHTSDLHKETTSRLITDRTANDGIRRPGLISQTFTLLHRSFIKSYRDIIAYQLRIAMYTALAIMMGTVWLRLPYTQTSIASFTTAIFFSGAFMSFMAVAYIPALIEDLQMFKKERANGLYGPLPFMIANFLIGMPYLFIITILFSIIAYWLCNLWPTAEGFWLWVVYLFLDLLAAEGLVVLISSTVPIFVVALAVTAFANGLWMCVGGFLVQPGTLNVFWKCKS